MTTDNKWWLPIALATAGWLGSATNSYFHNDSDLKSAITALQVQQKNAAESTIRIESKVDRLTEWAMGVRK